MTLPAIDFFVARERLVWEALVTGDEVADRALLADDFLGVYPTGFAGADEHAAALAGGPTVADYTIDRARLVAVGDDAALLCYAVAYSRPGGAPEAMYVSSLWCRRDGEWINTFSQDTPTGAAVP